MDEHVQNTFERGTEGHRPTEGDRNVELDNETVERLIEGAGHLYYPAFPDDDQRDAIREAVEKAEAALEDDE